MAIITAQAKFYNAFKCRVVDKNITANLSASFGASAIPVTVLRSDNNALRVNAGLSMTGSYAIKGGLIKGDQSMTVTSGLRLQFPTFVEIDWYKLEIPEGKNVTIQMEEGFVIEDRNKFPFALGSPLAFNGNLLSFRTPKRGFVTPFNSAFTLPNVAYTRVRPGQAAFTSAFSPTLSGQLNRFGVIDLQSAFQQTTVAGFRKFYASQMQAEFGGFFTAGGVARIATGLRIKQLASDLNAETTANIVGNRAKFMAADFTSSSNIDADVTQFIGTVQNLTSSANQNTVINFTASGTVNAVSINNLQSIVGVIKQFDVVIDNTSSMSISITGDNPEIPLLNFATNEINTPQTLFVSNVDATRLGEKLAIVGKRADGWHTLWTYSQGSGSNRYAHNNTQRSTSTALLDNNNASNNPITSLDSGFHTDGTTGGVAFNYSVGFSAAAHLSRVADWSTTPNQTSQPVFDNPPASRSPEYPLATPISGYRAAIALTPLHNSNIQRGLGFFGDTAVSSIRFSKHEWNQGSFTHNSSTAPTVLTLPFQKSWSASGFTSDSNSLRFALINQTTATNVVLDIGTTNLLDNNSPNLTRTSSIFTTNGSFDHANSVCSIWDDFNNNKFVALTMAADTAGIQLRAVKITDWTTRSSQIGAAKTVSGYGDTTVFQTARLMRVKGDGNGLAVLIYQRSSGTPISRTAVFGRFVSVNSDSLQIDIGPEIYFGSSSVTAPVNIAYYASDIAKTGNEYAFAMAWKEVNSPSSNTRGGTTFTTATG
jgi:hypothetical protein